MPMVRAGNQIRRQPSTPWTARTTGDAVTVSDVLIHHTSDWTKATALAYNLGMNHNTVPAATTDVVFFHGAGAGAREADAKLASSLGHHLGNDFSVNLAPLPEDDDTDDRQWLAAIGEAVSRAAAFSVLVGHSAGGYQLLKYLTSKPVTATIAAICIIAAPFPGADPQWTFDGFDLPDDLGRLLPKDAPVLLYASEDDEIVPFAHRDFYAAAIPGAIARTTRGGHQLADDLEAVAHDIRTLVRLNL